MKFRSASISIQIVGVDPCDEKKYLSINFLVLKCRTWAGSAANYLHGTTDASRYQATSDSDFKQVLSTTTICRIRWNDYLRAVSLKWVIEFTGLISPEFRITVPAGLQGYLRCRQCTLRKLENASEFTSLLICWIWVFHNYSIGFIFWSWLVLTFLQGSSPCTYFQYIQPAPRQMRVLKRSYSAN